MLSFWNFTLFLSSLLTRCLMKLLSLFRIEREMMMITFATEISLLNFHYSTYVSHIHTHSRLNMYRKINILIVFISQLTAALMILDSLLFLLKCFIFILNNYFCSSSSSSIVVSTNRRTAMCDVETALPFLLLDIPHTYCSILLVQ